MLHLGARAKIRIHPTLAGRMISAALSPMTSRLFHPEMEQAALFRFSTPCGETGPLSLIPLVCNPFQVQPTCVGHISHLAPLS